MHYTVTVATYSSLHDVQQLFQHHGDALVTKEACYGGEMLRAHKVLVKLQYGTVRLPEGLNNRTHITYHINTNEKHCNKYCTCGIIGKSNIYQIIKNILLALLKLEYCLIWWSLKFFKLPN